MKLTSQVIAAIDGLFNTLNTIGINKVVVEKDRIRAIDDKSVVGIITEDNVPDLDGKALTTNRVKNLVDRIKLAKAQGDVAITCTTGSTVDLVMLEIAAGRFKTQFRCAASDAIKIPKRLADKPAYEVTLPITMIPSIVQADASMGTDTITIASKDGKKVSVELVDATKDVCSFDLETDAVALDKTGSFCHRYNSKALISLMREAMKTSGDTLKLTIGGQGILFIHVNNWEFFTMPQI
jgi:hypothetical protein